MSSLAEKEDKIESKKTRVEREDWNVLIVYEELKKVMEIKEVTTENLMTITVTAIPIIQRMIKEPFRGQYKKKILLAVMRKLAGEFVSSPEDIIMINTVVNTLVSNTIDILINVARGKIDIGKGKKLNCCLIS